MTVFVIDAAAMAVIIAAASVLAAALVLGFYLAVRRAYRTGRVDGEIAGFADGAEVRRRATARSAARSAPPGGVTQLRPRDIRLRPRGAARPGGGR